MTKQAKRSEATQRGIKIQPPEGGFLKPKPCECLPTGVGDPCVKCGRQRKGKQ